jgi:hypothetical protein
VRFTVGGGAEYEIDLNKKNAAAFRKKLAPFLEHARRAGRGARRRAGRSAAGREHGAAIRAWANEQGIPVSGRGRIPADVVARFEAATGGGDAADVAVSAEPASVCHLALTPRHIMGIDGCRPVTLSGHLTRANSRAVWLDVTGSLPLLALGMALEDLEPPAVEEFADSRSRPPLAGVRFRSRRVCGLRSAAAAGF